jgi:twitching motility protein PilT
MTPRASQAQPQITVTQIDRWLRQLWELKGTDLLITSGAPPLVRVDGEIKPLELEEVLRPDDTERIVMSTLSKDMGTALKEQKEIDFSFNWEGIARFRGNAFHQRNSVAMSLRLIPFAIPTFADLGLPPAVEDFVVLPQGLVILTGPTGTGKSTTLASMIEWINQHRSVHIITLEDPIEYMHQHKMAAVNQREIGADSHSFDRALRSVLREDPDVLLVGEMRDPESIQTTLTIAETGHLVFATLHTNDTSQALDRIVDVFPADRQAQIRVQLANSLSGVIAQRLIPRIGGGLVAAFEVLVATHAVRNLVREGKSNQLRNVIATSQKEKMQTLEMSLTKLVADGVIEYEVAASHSIHPKEVEKPAPPEPSPEELHAGEGGRRLGRGRRK